MQVFRLLPACACLMYLDACAESALQIGSLYCKSVEVKCSADESPPAFAHAAVVSVDPNAAALNTQTACSR